ncbi:MAG: uroporphyrinogen-III synthase, partial [Planctomycetales bacterium]|nr:uroporphyrinogen-III synthase [Planctomycetales bacterium]
MIHERDKEHPSFAGLAVVAFESRLADEMSTMIQRMGGIPHVSPSMREVPLADNPVAVDFAKSVMTGELEIVILLTGVGFEMLLQVVERQVDRSRFLASLSDITTIVRGPKPAAALRKLGLQPSITVPAPNTWREVLATIDSTISVDSQHVALQEYGVTNRSLIAGLEARGAHVLRVPVYHWELPTDLGPIEANVHRLIAGDADVALFTSAQQLVHLQQVAERIGKSAELDQALRQVVVGSIGPTTSEALRDAGITVDFEPDVSKMGQLIKHAAAQTSQLAARKRRVSTTLSGPASDPNDTNAPWYDGPFLRACRREHTETTPIWLMRQAGRYLPEYRAIREKTTFLELCKDPALCAEIMVTTVKRLGVDAAIIFSDLLPILEPMGLDLEYAKGEGPVIHNPLQSPDDLGRFHELEDVQSLDFVFEAVRRIRADLPGNIPLIGFAGAPFTLASYAIEGGGSKNYVTTKRMMFSDPGAWRELMQRLSRSLIRYLQAQIDAGCQAVQIFDSW